MQISKRKIAAAVVAAGTAVTGAAIANQGTASASGSWNTMKFVSHDRQGHDVGKYSFAGDGVDKRHSKVIGYDSLIGTYNVKTNSLSIDVGVALKGGLITVELRQGGDSTKGRGKIIGGTGIYKGISGTITSHSPSKNSPITHVRLHYQLP